jgi:hypothetical protein
MVETLACAGYTCTAVGLVTAPVYPFYATLAPVVWTAGPDGIWHVVAGGTTDTSGGGGGGGGGGGTGVVKVTTNVSRFKVSHPGGHTKLAGRLSAKHGCVRKRHVKVMDKHGLAALTLTSDRYGRFASRLSPAVLARLGAKVWVKVPAKRRGTDIKCLATRSTKLPL